MKSVSFYFSPRVRQVTAVCVKADYICSVKGNDEIICFKIVFLNAS